jgi:DNA helicase-2/ATP-dependent DNA helicase PcrA
MSAFGSNYKTPGWQRAQARRGAGGFDEMGQRRYARDKDWDEGDATDSDHLSLDPSSPAPLRGRSAAGGRRVGGKLGTKPLTIEGELIAKSTGTTSLFAVGERVFHQKFGNGNVTAVDGNKLTIQFDKAGEKRVVDSFLERV